MADFVTAFQWCMQYEDPRMTFAQAPDAPPAGHPGPCYAISGINSGAWPDEFAQIAAIPQATRAQAVQQFYQQHFWNDWLNQLATDDLAKRVFDFGVNGGAGTSVKTLQRAVNSLGGTLKEDGGWGPMTLAAVNAANQAALVHAFIAARATYYMQIAANNPSSQQYLKGWLARAQA